MSGHGVQWDCESEFAVLDSWSLRYLAKDFCMRNTWGQREDSRERTESSWSGKSAAKPNQNYFPISESLHHWRRAKNPELRPNLIFVSNLAVHLKPKMPMSLQENCSSTKPNVPPPKKFQRRANRDIEGTQNNADKPRQAVAATKCETLHELVYRAHRQHIRDLLNASDCNQSKARVFDDKWNSCEGISLFLEANVLKIKESYWFAWKHRSHAQCNFQRNPVYSCITAVY